MNQRDQLASELADIQDAPRASWEIDVFPMVDALLARRVRVISEDTLTSAVRTALAHDDELHGPECGCVQVGRAILSALDADDGYPECCELACYEDPGCVCRGCLADGRGEVLAAVF